MDMQIYLGNAKGSVPFEQIIDNSFAEKGDCQPEMTLRLQHARSAGEGEAVDGSRPPAGG